VCTLENRLSISVREGEMTEAKPCIFASTALDRGMTAAIFPNQLCRRDRVITVVS
jgi:hypothetical protein